MIEKIAKKFALSQQGAKNYLKSSSLELINNLASMLPMALFIVVIMSLQGQSNFSFTPFSLAIAVLAVIILLYITNYFDYTFLYVAAYKESETNRLRLIKKMRELPISYYSQHSTAQLANILLNDVADQERFFSHGMPKMTGILGFMLVCLIGLGIYDPWMTLILFATYPLAAFIFWLSGRMEKRAHEKYAEQLTKQSSVFQEFIECMPEIRFFNHVKQTKKELQQLLDQQETEHLRTELPTAISQGLITSIIQLNLGLILIIGGYWWSTGRIDLLTFLIFLLVATRLNSLIISIFENVSLYRYTQVRIKRLQQLYNKKPEQALLKPVFEHYDFTVNNLRFSYNGKDEIIKGSSFYIPEKKVTAIVGPSGSGKTTLLRLLSKLYSYDSGEILLNGVDLKDIDSSTLFEQVSMVFQDVVLFNSSVRENIRIGRPDATEQEIMVAADLAQCDEFVRDLAMGYDTVIGENGSLLSGGQRQRIAIARAILKNSPLLFLDETSSGLDYENEYYVQKALSKLVKNKTVVVVAHRLKTIETADQILVMDDGRLVETGTKEELLKKRGVFARLWQFEINETSSVGLMENEGEGQ